MNKRLVSLILLLVCFTACEKDWNTLEKWEELYAVYGTFNLKDTAQYVRVSRVFAADDNPNNYMQVADCVNVKNGVLKVTLEHWQDGQLSGPPISMNPSHDFTKEDGEFASESYMVFKTTERLQIDSEYRIRVRNPASGYEMTAAVPTFGRRTLHQSFLEKRYFNITQYKPERLDYDGPLTPDQFEKMVQRFLYHEITSTDTIEKILDWRPWLEHYGYYKSDSTQQFTDAYFEFIGESIPMNPDVKRVAVGVDKLLILNSEELQLAIDLGASQGTLHYNPDYTNFDRGTGIIGFRYYYTFFAIQLKSETIDSLATGRFTKDLNFADAQGNWNK
jgi:hypothetical protein